MKSEIYPFLQDRKDIPTENGGYPKTGSHIFVNTINEKRYEIEVFETKIQENYPEITEEKLQFIIENIVSIGERIISK